MATVDFRSPAPYQQIQHPHRRAVGTANSPNRNDLRPLTKIVPDVTYNSQQHQNTSPYTPYTPYSRKPPQPPVATNTSPSSNQYPTPMITHNSKSRRTPSQSTTSTTFSSYNNPQGIPTRTPSQTSTALSRNASTRSGASTTPGSYVALMRKQKATVWCDRAQHEDPRLAAQHKAAKIRAAREITGKAVAEGRTSTSNSTGSGGVRSKIRHHGLPKATGYSYANMVGGGVPMRLSASEVGDEAGTSYDEDRRASIGNNRTSTGRSLEDANNRWLDVDQQQQQRRRNRYSGGSTTQGGSPNDDIPELEETPEHNSAHPLPNNHLQHQQSQPQPQNPYFPHPNRTPASAAPPLSFRRGSSTSEQESSFGAVGRMEAPKSEEKPRKTSEELRRRGSVDERSNTMGYMGQGRLFVANPDLSD